MPIRRLRNWELLFRQRHYRVFHVPNLRLSHWLMPTHNSFRRSFHCWWRIIDCRRLLGNDGISRIRSSLILRPIRPHRNRHSRLLPCRFFRYLDRKRQLRSRSNAIRFQRHLQRHNRPAMAPQLFNQLAKYSGGLPRRFGPIVHIMQESPKCLRRHCRRMVRHQAFRRGR